MPLGDYAAELVSTKITSHPAGGVLEVGWRIDGGRFIDRVVRHPINYLHASTKIHQAGQQQIKVLCNAAGFPGWLEDDTRVLHGARAIVTVSIIDAGEPIVIAARVAQ